MNLMIRKSLLIATGIGLALISTGCMTSPGHFEIVNNRSDSIRFGGYLLDENERVRIEAKHPVTGWQTIDWAQSDDRPVYYSGSQWFGWNTNAHIPAEFWTDIGEGSAKVEVRALQLSTGRQLYTFWTGFDVRFDPSDSLGGTWLDLGYGSTATVYSLN